jgi:predicted HNH restriction endonuclease
MKDRSEIQGGLLGEFTNADVAAILDMHDLSRSGRAFGNIQSRIDYACYLLGFPPLGLAATIPFDMAWAQGDRNWAFPLADMQLAAKSRRWLNEDFDAILAESRDLPGQAYMSWKQELSTNESKVRDWAFRLKNIEPTASILKSPTTARRNPAWTRDELILALDLYLRHRGSPPRKSSAQVLELSRRLASLASLSSAEIIGDTFRNANGVYMKMMNFMRIDPDYTKDGRVGLGSGSRLELPVWDEFAENPMALASAVKSILARIEHTEIVVDAPTVTKADLDHDLAGQRPEDMTVAALAALEEKFKNADPEVKERVSKYIERGAVGMLVKQHNGHKCQICDTLGVHPLGFKKQNGEHYVEAHHVMPVSLLTTGSLAASNVMTLCPNHHRQMHYGRASVTIEESIFVVEIDYRSIRIPRLFVDPEQPSAQSARPL